MTATISRKAKLFLCYAREDREQVEQFYDKLRNNGLLPWMDTRDIHAGENWERAIRRAIREADFFVFCLSPNSVEKRGQLQKELKEALEIWKGKLEDDIYIIPVRLQACKPPVTLELLQYVDLFQANGFDRLLQAVETGLVRLTANLQSPGVPTIVTREIKEDSEANRFSFSAKFPQINYEDSKRFRLVNSAVSEFVGNEQRKFVERATASATWKNEEKEQSATAWDDLSIFAKVECFTEHLISIRFELSSYGAGAAHPNSSTHTLNFQLNPAKELSLNDVFKARTPFLEVLSGFCISALHSEGLSPNGVQEPDDSVVSGAGPSHDNFSKFLMVEGGIRIIFDPYQVACYAAGRQEVLVPLEVIKGFVTEDVLHLLK